LASLLSNDFADGIADSALRLLAEGLPRVKADPSDLDARLKCQIGAWQSMIPIIAGVPMGASHAIGHVLGGTCDVPHGYTSCVMSPFVQAFNLPVNAHRQKRISTCLGSADRPASELLDELIRGLGMPRTLKEVGVTEKNFDLIAEYTLEDMWGRTNPRAIKTANDVMQILHTAMG
jgi:alcohol dehydrogenase class IV